MIKTSGRLCYQSSPRECAQCFPGKAPEDFFLRERYIKSFFELVDHFVSPSAFLRDRYVAWGLAPERISVIENGLPDGRTAAAARARRRRSAWSVRIFRSDQSVQGRRPDPRSIREAAKDVSFASVARHLRLRSRVAGQDIPRQDRRIARSKQGHRPAARRRTNRTSCPSIMRSIDWVVMGSVWWENSPVVIQEAFKFGRPVICPDIGGMAEKVAGWRRRPSLSSARRRGADVGACSGACRQRSLLEVGRVVAELFLAKGLR